jgi:DNA-binding phage protein
MAEKVAKAGIKREKGYLYYLDKQGDVSRAKMARGKKKGGNPTKVTKLKVKRAEGYLYFVDKQGDVSRAKMARRGKKK